MYQFELNHISNQEISREILSMIENLCDEFHLENDFGIISTSLQQLIEMIGTYTHHSDNTFSVTMTVDDNSFIVAIQQQWAMPGFDAHLQDMDNDEVMMLTRLVDRIECQDEGRQLSLEYEIHTSTTHSAANDHSIAEERQMTLLEKQLVVNPNETVKH